jgi:hypothetical protein
MPRHRPTFERPFGDEEPEVAPLTPYAATEAYLGSLRPRIEEIGADLRRTIATVLEAVAGPRPRPARISLAIGLDKSLASRLVRAVSSSSDLELMHLVPSPAGLQILASQAGRFADPASIRNLVAATERFEKLLDSVPGGRAAIDAQISESSPIALEKREHIAKQASFKAMSFLLGHFCDVLTTSLFLVPSANGKRVDAIEIHRRVGLRRMRPSTPLALLSFWSEPEDAADENAISFNTLDGERGSANPSGFLLPEFSTQPIPELEVFNDGAMTTLVLPGDPEVHAPSQLTSVFRIRNGWPLVPESRMHPLRGYVLHVPSRQVVREVYVHESLYADASPRVAFVLPGPRAATRPPRDDGGRHFTEVDLSAQIEQLPVGPPTYTMNGVVNHGAAVRHVLERAGHAHTRFRGWRCAMTYPVALVEMMWWLSHGSFRDPASGDGDGKAKP